MEQRKVTATEFKNRVGQYLDDAGREPVYITRHDRPLRVLVDVREYERLKSIDTREVYDLRTDDLPDWVNEALDGEYQGEPTPHLDHLME